MIKNYNKQKYLKNYCSTPLGIYAHLKQGAKRRNLIMFFNKDEFVKWYKQQKQQCYYCKRTLKELKKDKREHANLKIRFSIERKNNKIGYKLNNIVLACSRCNTIKSDYFTEKEMIKIGYLISHFI